MYSIGVKDQIPYFVWQWIRDWQSTEMIPVETIRVKLGDDLWNTLHPYQRVCVQKAVSSKKCYIADEMGTGKTFQSLATCKYFQETWPVLILCPSSLRYTWRSEITNWLGIPETDIFVAKSSKHFLKNCDDRHNFMVLSYSLLNNREIVQTLIKKAYKIVIFDEAHYVKSLFSKRANASFEVSELADVKLLLSGTPFNYPNEMFQQIRILNPRLYPKFFNYSLEEPRFGEYYYAQRYCKPQLMVIRGGHNTWSFKGYAKHEELNALFNTFMIRRRKTDILTQLPEKIRICITLDPLPVKQAKQIADQLKGGTDSSKSTESKYMEAFRSTCKYKLPNVLAFIKEQVLGNLSNNKVLIFFHHEHMQTALEELLTNCKCSYFVISGSTSPMKRDEYKTCFQTTDQYSVGLLSITAAGVGLTLTAANTVIFTEILFGPNDHLQAEDRAHRLGQKSVVNIVYLIQPKTTDDINFGMIRKKERESSIMLSGHATGLSAERLTVTELNNPTPKRKEPESPELPKLPTVQYATNRKRMMVQVFKLREP
jgi:SWI/SNF-related matrix-associated actin-dependent regulator 1 of chromatin subfamily A